MELTTKDIAAWHRKQAKQHQALAQKHREMAESVVELNGAPTKADSSTERATVTLEMFEKAMRVKGGRVAHLAKRLKTTPDAIEGLLKEPNCKFVVGARGFIIPRQ